MNELEKVTMTIDKRFREEAEEFWDEEYGTSMGFNYSAVMRMALEEFFGE